MANKGMLLLSLKKKSSDFHCDDCAGMETATLPNLPQVDDKRQ